MDNKKVNTPVSDNIEKPVIACKLTTADLQKRKATVIASLRDQVLEKDELPNGYSFKFKGSDAVIDELSTFIKTERICCQFFDFGLSISGDSSYTLLNITGPEGAKQFIEAELNF